MSGGREIAVLPSRPTLAIFARYEVDDALPSCVENRADVSDDIVFFCIYEE